MNKETKKYILESIQERLDCFADIDLFDYITACGLEPKDEEWAFEHLSVSIKIVEY